MIPITLFIFFTLDKRYIGIIICLLLISYFPYGAWWNDFANTFPKIIMHPKSILLVSYESIWTIVQTFYRTLHKWLRADNEACNTGFSKQPAWFCNAFLFLQWFFRNFVSLLTTQTFRISSFNSPHGHQSLFLILPCSFVSLSSSDSNENICGLHIGSKSYGFNVEKSRIIDSFERLKLLSSVKQEDILLSEYSYSDVSNSSSYDDSRVDVSFCKLLPSSKTLGPDVVEKSLGYCNSWVSSSVSASF